MLQIPDRLLLGGGRGRGRIGGAGNGGEHGLDVAQGGGSKAQAGRDALGTFGGGRSEGGDKGGRGVGGAGGRERAWGARTCARMESTERENN